jgi:hypothetical protein
MEFEMAKLIIITSLCALFLSACGGGGGTSHTPPKNSGTPVREASVDKNGYCTAQFIADYNNIVYEKQRLSDGSSDANSPAKLQAVSSACDKFFASHLSDITCIAEVKYKTTSVSSASVKNECDQVKESLNRINSPAPSTPEDGPVTKLEPSKLMFKVLDVGALELTNGSTQIFLQDGITVTDQTVDKNRVFCKVVEGVNPPTKGSVYTAKLISQNGIAGLNVNHVLITSINTKGAELGFICATASEARISLADIRKAMRNIVTISFNK